MWTSRLPPAPTGGQTVPLGPLRGPRAIMKGPRDFLSENLLDLLNVLDSFHKRW